MASDPAADFQNLMGMQGLFGENPYLQYQGKIPMAGYYTGDAGNLPPTDATGKPIQSFVDYNAKAQADYQAALAAYNAQPAAAPASSGKTLQQMIGSFTPLQQQWWAGAPANEKQMAMNAYGVGQGAPTGTTLNSTPPGAPDNSALLNYIASQNAVLGGSPSSMNQGGFGAGNNVYSNSALMQMQNNAQQMDIIRRQQQGAAPAAPTRGPPPSPPDLRQAYLTALSNPGPVPTYGATIQPGSATTGARPDVIGAFLAAQGNKPGTPFTNTLKALQSGVA